MLTQFVSREGPCSLVAQLVQAVQHDNPVVGKVPPTDWVRCHIIPGDIDTGPGFGGSGAGDGVLLVWSSRTWGQPVLPGGPFVPVFAAGMVGCFSKWPVSSRETRDGPVGRVSLLDHRQSEKS